jgi:peptidoglycan/LPS O-acetylase OafA/YrhL
MGEDLRGRLAQPARVPFRYVSSLDGVRGIGILIVMWGHYSAGLSKWASTRFFGVQLTIDLFFVLSGFLITSLLIEEWSNHQRISLRNFYVRRGLRLLPALYALLGTIVIVVVVTRWAEPKLTIIESGAAAFYVYPFVLIARANRVLLYHLWTLSIEEWFYFAWPAFLIAFGLRPGTSRRFRMMVGSLIAFCLICFATRAFATRDSVSLLIALFRPDSLFYGALLAFLIRWMNEFPNQRRDRVLDLIGPISFVGFLYFSWIAVFKQPPRSETVGWSASKIKDLFYENSFQSWNYRLGIVSCFGMVLHLVRTPGGRLSRILSWRPFVFIGIISYALYLWHQAIFQLELTPKVFNLDVTRHGHHVLTAPEKWGVGLAVGAVSFLIAMASRKFIEVPALRLKKRFEVVHYESKR